MSAAENVLEVRGLELRLAGDGQGPPLVGPLDLSLERGRVLGLVGPSGCGKSMTCLALLGLLPPGVERAAGTIRLCGQAVDQAQEERLRDLRGRAAACVFQNPGSCFDPVFTIGAHFQETLAAHGRAGESGRVAGVLREVGFQDPGAILGHYPFQMSGGMLQRVMIALALLLDAPLLLADEPTTDLDLLAQARVLELLGRVRRTRDMAVLLVTHDLSVVAHQADEVAVMLGGRIVERAPAREIFSAPRHEYTRALLAAHRRLYGPCCAGKGA